MTTRAVGAGAGLTWLQRALDLGRDNPKAIFGGALLLLTTLIAMAIGLALVMTAISLAAGTSGLISGLVSLLTGVAISALMAVLMAGYLQLLDAVEQGRPVSALQVFSVLGQSVVAVRAAAFMVLLMLAQNLLLGALVGLLAPDIGSWYLQTLQSPENSDALPALPQGFGPALLIFWAVGLLSYGVQAIGLGQIALRDKGVVDALQDGVAGTLRNLLPLLVLFLLAMVAAVVLALLLVIGNTIRLHIENRRSEIEVIKLVGGTDGYVRRPFLYMGALYGLGAGLLAWGLLAFGLDWLNDAVVRLAGLYGSDFALDGVPVADGLSLLLGALFLGYIGAWLAVARHLSELAPR